jgi:glyoxylase-like metal-dependent hydrolase (beta-lactamase superfamily II)
MPLVNVGYDSTNYYVLPGQGARLLLDVGFPGTLPKLTAALQRFRLSLRDLTAVVATHYHPDHAGLIQELKSAGLQHLVLAPQLPGILALAHYVKPNSGYVPITTHDAAIIPLDHSRAWLARLGLAGQFVATPGHSADSVSLVLDSGEAFTGDLTLPALAPDEAAAAILNASWAALRAAGARTLYPGHGPTGRPLP